MALYLGIDIAGASNTWATALTPSDNGLRIVFPPRPMRLAEIVAFCDEHSGPPIKTGCARRLPGHIH